MATIQLFVGDEGNRNALNSLLSSKYAIERDQSVKSADLYLVEDASFPDYHDALQARKREDHPTFCPVVLVRREDTRVRFGPDAEAGTDAVPLIDDIVTAPVEKPVFFRRLENLLVRREQSIWLTRRYEESEAIFQALFHAIPDPAFVLDGQDDLVEINDAFGRLTSRDREAIIGRSLSDVPEFGFETEVIVTNHDAASEEGGAEARTISFTDADDRTRHGKLAIHSGTVAGSEYTVGILADVTELKEKTERLEEFANIVAHDLRNPLQVALGRVPLLRDRHPESVEYLDAMERSLTRMEEMIDKLLTVARVGQTGTERTEVTLGEVVRSAWQSVETDSASLELRSGRSLLFHADRDQVLQLFENLFRNAIEHGGSSVTVRVGTVSDGFYVEDDGPGIPPDVREEILEIGYTTESEGAGLGLSIVTEIVEAHDWSLDIGTGDSGGARFEIHGVRFGR